MSVLSPDPDPDQHWWSIASSRSNMSLLNVTVKKARYVGAQAAQYNTYVTLKLQNVKSTTVTVKGANPCWEQDFLFETNDLNTGLLIEVWSKGMIWDRAMGYHWIPLQGVQYANEDPPLNGGLSTSYYTNLLDDDYYDGCGQWLSLEAELVMRDGEVVGTKNPTGHSLLIDCRFELPFGRCDPPSGWKSILQDSTLSAGFTNIKSSIDPENTEGVDLQRKLEMLNNIMDQEARAEQARRQMQYFGHSGYSEDSDYTSDLNYPIGQHANSSASQFRSAAGQMHTPQRSLETSRENSYERDDTPNQLYQPQHNLPTVPAHQHHLSPGHAYYPRHNAPANLSNHYGQRYSPNADDYEYNTPDTGPSHNSTHQCNDSADSEPLFYNSRPRNNFKQRYTSQDTWYSAEYGSMGYSQQSIDDSIDNALGHGNYSETVDYYSNSQPTPRRNRGGISGRRPSLERQTTLYDDQYYNNTENGGSYYPSIEVTNSRENSFNQSCEEYYDTSSYVYQDERYGQDEEDRQWDSGGFYPQAKTNPSLPAYNQFEIKRRNSAQLPKPPAITKSSSYYEGVYSAAATRRRLIPQIPQRRAVSRQSSLNDYEGCRTPENSSHRGASLPPTPTTTPKLLARLAATGTVPISLPPTPGRQLPKPNLNHRSAKARRGSVLKRTASADYAEFDQDQVDAYNDYARPGAISATHMYNEDYNYAYQSIDNLPDQQPQPPAIIQDDYDDYEHHEVRAAVATTRKKLLARRTNSPLLQQQNTDSLESHDDELKDSFDTAVSSVSSSIVHPVTQSVITVTTPQQYNRDQNEPKTKAIVTTQVNGVDALNANNSVMDHMASALSVVSAAAVSAVAAVTNNRNSNNNNNNNTHTNSTQVLNGFQQYKNRDLDELTPEPALLNHNYFHQQESIESYTEEVSGSVEDIYNNKISEKESPVSVIHVDPYHPSLQRIQDPYAPPSSTTRRPSIDPYRPLSPSRRTSADNYSIPSRKSSIVDQYARKQSLDPYQPLSRRTSVRHTPSPSEMRKQDSVDQVSPTASLADQQSPEKKSVSFEEEEVIKPVRRTVTAKQRWHWAYNKIIMQLNKLQHLLLDLRPQPSDTSQHKNSSY